MQKLHDFIEKYSFATLISHNESESVASHLPILLDRDVPPHGRLVGHMARANRQWKHANGNQVLVIFRGPHSYISPTWYNATNVVPTWNYVTVHAHGVFRLEEDRDQLREIVRRYVEFYEATMDEPWTMDQAESGFIERLLGAIVGFTIDIDRFDDKWKLSQNHDQQRRERVIQALRQTGRQDAVEVARFMSATDASSGQR